MMLQGDQYEYVYGGPAGGAFSTDSLHLASEVVKVSRGSMTQQALQASSLAAFQKLQRDRLTYSTHIKCRL